MWKSLAKTLDAQEKEWIEKQKVLTKDKIKKDCNDALIATEYVHILLKKCKTWGGPLTDVTELERIVVQSDDDQNLKSILRSEIAYRKRTSNDAKTRPQLYRLNQLSTAEMKVNLTLILTTETEIDATSIPEMPTEDEMKSIFFGSDSVTIKQLESESLPEPEVTVNEPCIVIWDTNTSRQWYLGICVSEESDGTYTVEHLERCFENESKTWKHPSRPDIQNVDSLQILPCNIIGGWDLRKRVMTFNLENWETIDVLFRSFY